MACCVFLLGSATAITGLMAGLDHWGSYRRFLKRSRPQAELPVDVVAVDPLAVKSSLGAFVSSLPNADDYAGDEPDEPAGDRLAMWLCDDGGGQKHFGLAASPGDARWLALVVDPSQRPPSDDHSPPALSLSSLHVRLQI